MVETKKSDWENALQQYTALYVNDLVSMEAKKHMIEYCEEKIKEFPEDDESEVKEELKEMLK